VLVLLREAAKALRRGLLTEDQLVKLLQQEVKVSLRLPSATVDMPMAGACCDGCTCWLFAGLEM
jgi:hypothetical protein